MLEEKQFPLISKVFILAFVFVLTFACCLTGQNNYSADVAFAAVGDNTVVEFTAYPLDACQDCTWELTIDEDKMTSWLTNRVKEKNISDYIQLTIDGKRCTVTALQYFKYGIQYTTYYTLTATSTQNTELSVTCSIKLG